MGNGGDNTIWIDQSLPVTLSSFTARAADRQVTLSWETQSEIDNLGFEIWRSASESGSYQMIAGYQTREDLKGQINSNEPRRYRFKDIDLVNGQTYWYKLADVDVSGKRTYHGPLSVIPHDNGKPVVNTGSLPDNFALHQNYPNPFNPETTLQFDVPGDLKSTANATISVFNTAGQLVSTLYEGPVTPGTYTLQWDGTGNNGVQLASGLYFAVFKSDAYAQTIKMMLLR
ncbi:MAG: FlgD immunoglobulin-like domain containing protein [Calditrichia bacterium]